MEKEFKNHFSEELVFLLEKIQVGRFIKCEDAKDGYDLLTIDIGPIEVPQYPIVEVRSVERVEILVKDGELPCVYCRENFELVPHMNIDCEGRKSLCLFDVSFDDIRHDFNPAVLLNRILFWFKKTARGELHAAGQNLDPFFPYVKDTIILKEYKEKPIGHFKVINCSGGTLLKETTEKKMSDVTFFELCIKINKPYDKNIINKLPCNLGELVDMFDDDIIQQIKYRVQELSTIKSDAKIYKEVFEQMDTLFKKTKLLLIITIELVRKENAKTERYEHRAFLLDVSFSGLCKSLGVTANDKAKKIVSDSFKSIILEPYNIMPALTKKLAATCSGSDTLCNEKKFVQIGLGTLGSQFANNCIRTGYGRWTYIDNDIILPHNTARHCLNSEYIGKNKAASMKDYAEKILEDNSIIQGVVEKNIFSNDVSDIIEKVKKANMIVDTSASVSAGRHICNSIAGKVRCVSFFMNPLGTDLVMLLESADRNIKLDTLEMQYYKILYSNDKFRSHLKRNESFSYSSQCRSNSVIISQDNVSIFAGIASKAIKYFENDKEAHICIWKINENTVEKYEELGEFYREYNINGWIVKISKKLESDLYELRREKLPCETGGVLIGSLDYERKMCYIVDSISNLIDSIECSQSFIRGCAGLSNKIEEIEQITVGNLGYVGEWHSHPVDNTKQSESDIILMDAIADYNMSSGKPACMIIVGETKYSVYIR